MQSTRWNSRTHEPSRTVITVFWISVAAAYYDYGSSSTAGSSDFYFRFRRTLRRRIIIVFHVVFIRYAYVLRVFHRRNVGRLQLVRCFPIDHQFVRYSITGFLINKLESSSRRWWCATPSPMLIPSTKILYSTSSTAVTSSGPPLLHSLNIKICYRLLSPTVFRRKYLSCCS